MVVLLYIEFGGYLGRARVEDGKFVEASAKAKLGVGYHHVILAIA